jgi:small subunit ribosomal protein S13
MIYIFESELLENKSVFIALTKIFGVGNYNSSLICKNLGLSKNFKVKNLSKEKLILLVKTIESLNLSLSSDLKKDNILKFKKLVSIKSYRGLRKYQGLPVRGQRTHTNAKTSRKKAKIR